MGILALVIAAVFAALFFASKKAAPPCRLLAPSALAICACALCLSATTYAWFTATSTSTVAKIESATYEVDVSVDDNAAAAIDGTYSVTLDAGTHYVTLHASGTATTGYCKLEYGTTTVYTEQIVPDTTSYFAVTLTTRGELKITPVWGTRVSDASTLSAVDPATTSLFMMPEPPETPEPTPEAQPETPENPDDTYLVQGDTEPPETDPEPPTE